MMNNKTEQVTELARAIGNYNIQDGRKYALLASYLYDEGYRKVPKGEWVFKEYSEDTYTNLTRIYECSLCGRTIECLNEADEPYCHCGAQMLVRRESE